MDDKPALPMNDERLPPPLTPTERIALEFIKAGREPSLSGSRGRHAAKMGKKA
jgi:hypothetical protein